MSVKMRQQGVLLRPSRIQPVPEDGVVLEWQSRNLVAAPMEVDARRDGVVVMAKEDIVERVDVLWVKVRGRSSSSDTCSGT